MTLAPRLHRCFREETSAGRRSHGPGTVSSRTQAPELTGDLDAGEDVDDSGEADEQDQGQAHPLGGGLGGGLGVGELAVADGGGLRGEAGADLGAFDTGQRDGGGQFGQLADAQFTTELAEG